jgi:tetratricopeptide (TPR) repeat protein
VRWYPDNREFKTPCSFPSAATTVSELPGDVFLSNDVAHHQYEHALAALEVEANSPLEKVEMLMEIAMGLQMRPKTPEQILDAVALYDRAIELCPPEEILLTARLHARKSTALYMVPCEHSGYLIQAREELEVALTSFGDQALPEELAEAQLNMGLILQSLVADGRAKITDAIESYQKSLRVFTKANYPTEYSILHNNLATAFLSIPTSDERAKMREALAVQSFEAALEVITLEDNPSEYAMLQNNLGNALQYVSSSHALENNTRALIAYDEALKVRMRRTTPLPYATTICNKANCLRNLPDTTTAEGPENLRLALSLYEEAHEIFTSYGETSKMQMLDGVIADIRKELGAIVAAPRKGRDTEDGDDGDSRETFGNRIF